MKRAAEGVQNPIYKTVGKNIQKVREIKGITVAEMGRLTDYCPQSIRNVERGKQRISLDKVDMFAKCLNVPMSTFFTDRTYEVRHWKNEYIQTLFMMWDKTKTKLGKILILIG